MYVFVLHPPLSWDASLYGYCSGYDKLLSGLCQLLVLPVLASVLKVRRTLLIIVATACQMASTLVIGLSFVTWMVFLGKQGHKCIMYIYTHIPLQGRSHNVRTDARAYNLPAKARVLLDKLSELCPTWWTLLYQT